MVVTVSDGLNKPYMANILPYRGLGTGVPRALGAWPKIDLVDEREANQFRAVVWRIATPQVAPQVAAEVLSLLAAMQGEMKRRDIQMALGLKDREHFRTAYLAPALAGGLVEMTVPDKPQSRLQRYRITAAGHACLRTPSPQSCAPA